jgi:plasmid maintenance system antidote protein VapI
MGEYSVKRPLKRPPVHPGELLREDVLPALGLSVSEAARRMRFCDVFCHQFDIGERIREVIKNEMNDEIMGIFH